jgi:hypothetical protein
MKRTRAGFVILIVAFLSSMLLAQKVGTSSLQFLKVLPDARGTAMGDAIGSLASGVNAVFWNPAGITRTNGIEISGSLTMWLFDTRQGALAAALPIGDWGVIGLQFQYVDYGSILVTRADQLHFVGSGTDTRYNPGLTGETFTPSTYLVGLTYSKQLTDKFSTGVTAKYVRESLWGSSTVSVVGSNGVVEDVNTYADVLLFDFGLQYNTGYRTVRVSASVQNFGSQVQFAKEGYPAPMAFRIGTAADLFGKNGLLGEATDSRFTAAFDLFQPNDYMQQMHLGVEYSLVEAIFLRAGYKFYYDNLTLGAGVLQSLGGFPLSIDYSYGSMGDYLPSVHRFSVGVQLP